MKVQIVFLLFAVLSHQVNINLFTMMNICLITSFPQALSSRISAADKDIDNQKFYSDYQEIIDDDSDEDLDDLDDLVVISFNDENTFEIINISQGLKDQILAQVKVDIT